MSRTYSSFETTPRPAERRYINLLDAPKFSTIPHMCVVDGVTNSTCFRFPWFADIRYCWRIPLPHEYPSVRTKVLESERIRRAVENAARETATLEPELHNLAYQFFLRMRAHLSKVLCKIASYMLFKTFRRLSSRVLVCPSQMERLVEAEKTAVPVIYLPLHRSHLDYLLITWTVWHWKIRLPHIASGDNLNLSGLGWLLRSFGAFFIRRQFHGGTEDSPSEELYRAVLNTYVLQLLKSGMSIEFFLEGTRSRFGKSLLPKNGLISNIVSAVREGEIFDVQLVPVSITYEQPVEGVLVEELKGCGKKRESIWTIISGLMTCFGTISRCGDIIVDYGTPVLLSTHLKLLSENIEKYKGLLNLGHETNPNSYRELVPWHGDDSSDRMLIRAIGYDIVFQAQQRKPINCSSMIALLMVSLYRDDPVPLSKFLVSLNMLAQEIHNLGFMVVGWTGEGVVDVRKQFTKGLVYLNDTVVLIPAQNSTEDYADEPFLKLRSQTQDCLLLLAYHKNGAIAPYVLISMAALSILSFCNVKTGFEECVQRTFHLCNLMQYEIIFCSPCDDLRYEITKALEFLNYDEENTTENNMAAMSPPSEGSSQNARFSLNMYANILRPFLQSCLIVILDLLKRPKTDKVEKDSDYIREFIRNFFKTKSELDVMPEAVNQDTMYNAIKLLRLKGIIEKNGLEILDELKARIYEDAFKTFLIYRTVEKQANV